MVFLKAQVMTRYELHKTNKSGIPDLLKATSRWCPISNRVRSDHDTSNMDIYAWPPFIVIL